MIDAACIKRGHLVYNGRWREWGQVTWDARRHQYQTGVPGWIQVWELGRSCTLSWPVADLEQVVHLGKVLATDVTLAVRLEKDWQDAEDNGRPWSWVDRYVAAYMKKVSHG